MKATYRLVSVRFFQRLQVGLGSDLRELALTALAEWASAFKNDSPASHDLCRFTDLLVQLVESCKFVEDPSSYSSHQQIARLLCDLSTQNASSLCCMPQAELTGIWSALVQLLRYPSAAIQVDALTGMVALTKQGGLGGPASQVRIDLEQLAGILHVLSLKNHERMGVPSDRSSWLLRCLGGSCSSEWCRWMKISASFDILETDLSGQQVQSQRLGMVKVHSKELLSEICRRPLTGSECNFGVLCRVAGGLVARSLAGDEMDGSDGSIQSWLEEFDSAISLVESAAATALKSAEKDGPKEFLATVVQSMLSFLQQVCVKTVNSPGVEHRRLEFLSCCSVFYKHWSEEVLRDVLARVVAHIREGQRPETRGIKLEQRALDTLVAISKSGWPGIPLSLSLYLYITWIFILYIFTTLLILIIQ